MAIHYLQSNMEGEDIALDDVHSSSAEAADNDDAVGITAETDFGGGTGIQDDGRAPTKTPLTLSLEGQLKQTAINSAYETWGIPQGVVDPNDFVYTEKDGLRLINHLEINLTNINTKKGLALSTIAGSRGGAAVIKGELGFSNYIRPQKISAATRLALQEAGDTLTAANAKLESAPPQDLPTVASDAEETTSSVVETMETAPSEAGEPEQLPLRELRGLNKALQTIRGELVNNLAKLTELDNHITREQNKLDEPDIGDFERRRIAERIRDLKDERVSRLEAASASREALRSQISRIRETINRLINEDTTLAERIRTLFREQGITIVSILTALGMVISTLVLAVGIGGASAAPPTPPSKAGLREWVKKYLHALGRVLAKLAAKAGAALPGIIGSVVGWLLNLLSKTAGWLASNLWALMLAVGSILLIAAREWLAKR